jgi:hypothetical protein
MFCAWLTPLIQDVHDLTTAVVLSLLALIAMMVNRVRRGCQRIVRAACPGGVDWTQGYANKALAMRSLELVWQRIFSEEMSIQREHMRLRGEIGAWTQAKIHRRSGTWDAIPGA